MRFSGKIAGTMLFVLVLGILLPAGTHSEEENPFVLADSYFKTREYEKAREIYEDIYLTDSDEKVREKAFIMTIQCDFRMRRYGEVIINLRRYFRNYEKPEFANLANLLMSECLFQERRYDEALEYLRKVKKPLKSEALGIEAMIMIRRGDFQGASRLLERGRGVLPSGIYASVAKAHVAARAGSPAYALKIIRSLSDSRLEEHGLLVEKGEILWRAGRVKEAEDFLLALIEGGESELERVEAQRVLFDLYTSEGRYREAAEIADEIISYVVDDEFKLKAADVMEKLGEHVKSLSYVVRVRNPKLRTSEVKKRLLRLIESGNPQAPDVVARFSYYVDPKDPFVVDLAKKLVLWGKRREAKYLLRLAFEGRRKGEARLLLARIYMEEGDYEKATKLLRLMLFNLTYSVDAMKLLGEVNERQGNYATALKYYRRAEKFNPSGDVYERMGDVYLKLGERDLAIENYVKSAGYGYASSALKVADLLYSDGKVEEAREYYIQALKGNLSRKEDLQWAYYQAAKLTGNDLYLKKVVEMGGLVGKVAEIVREEEK